MERPLGPKHNPELRRLYEVEGLTLRQIGKRFGVTYQAVHERLSRMGIPMRPRFVRHNPLDVALLHRLYITNGMTVAEIAAKLDLTPYFVSRELRHHEIPIRRTGTRPAALAKKAKA